MRIQATPPRGAAPLVGLSATLAAASSVLPAASSLGRDRFTSSMAPIHVTAQGAGWYQEVRGEIGTHRVELQARDIWNDGSRLEVTGHIGDTQVNLTVEDVWRDGTTLVVRGRIGAHDVNLSGRDIWRDKSRYDLYGSVGNAQLTMDMQNWSRTGHYWVNSNVGAHRVQMNVDDVFNDGRLIRASGKAVRATRLQAVG